MVNPVLESARHIAAHASHVHLSPSGIEETAVSLLPSLPSPDSTSVSTWSTEPLHPTSKSFTPRELAHWVFLACGTLNFSFWSDLPSDQRFGVRYKDGVDGKGTGTKKVHTGYWSLIAALHRARDDNILNLLEPTFWKDAPPEVWALVFRSDQKEQIPLLEERCTVIKQVGTVLCTGFGGSYITLIEQANHSALRLVELVCTHFPSVYDDRATFAEQDVFIRKRAQILVAETWAAFDGQGWGRFDDIDELTMFADYRVPQILHSLGTITYSPHLTDLLQSRTMLAPGSAEEVEIRGCSILVVEEIRVALAKVIRERELDSKVPNAVQLDFLLWDLAKRKEGDAKVEHHRTRSIWY